MVQNSMTLGSFLAGMTRGHIVLIPKRGDQQQLTKWGPITLLNVAYNIVAKALQLHLQNILMDVISPKQIAFLPCGYILHNVLFHAKIIEWIQQSQQDLIFLTLDFQKAYDSVLWKFLFQVMAKLGMPNYFI